MGPFPVDTCLSEGLLCLGASCQEEGRKFLSASFPAGWGGGRAVEMLRAGRCFRPDCGGHVGAQDALGPRSLLFFPTSQGSPGLLCLERRVCCGCRSCCLQVDLGVTGIPESSWGRGEQREDGWCYGGFCYYRELHLCLPTAAHSSPSPRPLALFPGGLWGEQLVSEGAHQGPKALAEDQGKGACRTGSLPSPRPLPPGPRL